MKGGLVDEYNAPADPDDEIFLDAQDKFKRCQDFEANARMRMADDLRFAEGDSINGYQWDQQIASGREIQGKPCLTFNQVRQKNFQIINDARQNKPGIEIRAVGDGATYKAAQVYEGLVRHIEYISNAQAAYDTSVDWQVKVGRGYWRVLTRYTTDAASTSAFEQEIYIGRIPDPNSVYMDPGIQENDGSDAEFGFVFRDWNRKDYEKAHPDLADELSTSTLSADHGWLSEDLVREAEFFRKVQRTEWLTVKIDGTVAREKDVGPEELAYLKATKAPRRKVTKPEIEVFKILGTKVIDKKIWPGAYIPLVAVIGERTVIDGELDLKGHTRAQRSAQQYYNFTASASAEFLAGQTKTPWTGPAAAFEGFEDLYEASNTQTLAFLPYNQYDDDGREIQRPTRIDPPQSAQAYVQHMQIADQQMMKVTGQHEANLGAPSNETSGVAIQQRQRKGDNATYHYIDRLGQAIRFTGRILIDLIPKIYDTERVIQILSIDGTQQSVKLSPDAPEAHTQVQDQEDPAYDPAAIAAIFNPNVGRYEVEADIGPSYATRRQDEFAALSGMMTQNQDLMSKAGDLLFRAADFPGADVIAERLRRAVPPQLLGQDGPPPEVQQLQQQHAEQLNQIQQESQQIQAHVAKLQAERDELERKLNDKTEDQKIADYRAETERLKAIGAVDPATLQIIIRQLMEDMTQTPLPQLLAHHAQVEATTQPAPPMMPPGMQPDPSQMPPDAAQQPPQVMQ